MYVQLMIEEILLKMDDLEKEPLKSTIVSLKVPHLNKYVLKDRGLVVL